MDENSEISSREARFLEKKLKANPDDLLSHTVLLSYYMEQELEKDDTQVTELKQKHILWMIENHPETKIAGDPDCHIDKFPDPIYYNEAKELWVKQIEFQPTNAAVLGHAGQFFLEDDLDLSESLIKQAEVLDPNNYKWSADLGQIYTLKLINISADARIGIATQAVEKFERALSLIQDHEYDSIRPPILAEIAKAALEAGDTRKAKDTALDLLKKYKEEEDGNYNDKVFDAHQVLGRVALLEGDIPEAKARLITSAKTSGSCSLSSFGPSMTLAKELMQQGEKATVIKYLHLCAKFWDDTEGDLKKWESEIVAGQIPDFL